VFINRGGEGGRFVLGGRDYFGITHWVGLREHLQETPIVNGKKPWFPVDFPHISW